MHAHLTPASSLKGMSHETKNVHCTPIEPPGVIEKFIGFSKRVHDLQNAVNWVFGALVTLVLTLIYKRKTPRATAQSVAPSQGTSGTGTATAA